MGIFPMPSSVLLCQLSLQHASVHAPSMAVSTLLIAEMKQLTIHTNCI
jgi:hypothetical protein